MGSTYKILAQSNPSATTLTDIYTVPAATSATISTVSVCNHGAVGAYSISVAQSGAADATEQYIVYGAPIDVNQSHFLTLGITLAATDVLRVYGWTSDLVFNVFGVEIT